MIQENLKKYHIILGSSSPRRKELLSSLNIKFVISKSHQKEYYPTKLKEEEIAEFIAKSKAAFICKKLSNNYLLITADTIVLKNNNILHKPKDKNQAFKLLTNISGKTHQVITGVCIKSKQKEVTFSSKTEVTFNKLSKNEITYYIDNFKPFDKAGSYGIQEWIGYIGVKKINGSYNNVVGLPTSKLYQKLKLFI